MEEKNESDVKLFVYRSYVKRKAFKNIKLGTTENRNEQFENITSKDAPMRNRETL
jgi:hypothetical protein